MAVRDFAYFNMANALPYREKLLILCAENPQRHFSRRVNAMAKPSPKRGN